ncbi:MAG: gamma-glutamylcyclotransferase [Lachnospiraceae bacterium]|nr:gamma-glutamylcyclotransferase [Lachnospiraceae bacterium]
MNKKTLYVAYGSNLNIPQMRQRCPNSKLLGVGEIKDYRLEFKALGMCAYATIAPYAGEFVPAVVWEIDEWDEKRLDIYEGFPTHYYKQNVEVTLADRKVIAMVYIMNNKAHHARPSKQYFDVVMEGYNSFGLNEKKLYEAFQLSE